MTSLNREQDSFLRTAHHLGIRRVPTTIAGPMADYVGIQSQSGNFSSTAPDNDLARLAHHAQLWLWTALIFGTGSVAHLAPTSSPVRTSDSAAVLSPSARLPAQVAVSVSESLAVIRSAFSLQISQIAEILGVSRPTIYGWISHEQQPQPRHRDRLNDIYALAEFWNTKSALPLDAKALLAPDAAGATLIDCLKDPEMGLDAVKARLQALSRQASMEVASSRVADLASKYGIAVDQNRLNNSEYDVMTRPPMDET